MTNVVNKSDKLQYSRELQLLLVKRHFYEHVCLLATEKMHELFPYEIYRIVYNSRNMFQNDNLCD